MTTTHREVPRAVRLGATTLGLGFLGVQVAFVLYAHVVQPFSNGSGAVALRDGCAAQPTGCTRYFAWAPNDYLVTYHLAVTVDDVTRTDQQANQRYHLAGLRWEFPVSQLQDVIRAYETTYGRDDHAQVVLTYSISGRSPVTWTWHG